MDLIRAFNFELVYIRTAFPMGKKGLVLKDGSLSPSGEELRQLIALWGPAVKAGDQARITNIIIKSNSIHFEINGGPQKKQKWYQHISVSAGGGETPIAPTDQNANPRGSYVDLIFDKYVPDLTPQQLKDALRPVFDFNAKTALEAYLETVPPKVKAAIEKHQVLVGMNREMVIYAKGRAPKKIREKDGDLEYEDWIYGEPPEDVYFVRLVGDEVVRIETMKVNGERIIRADKEIELEPGTSVAKGSQQPEVKPSSAPSLRRPGEEAPTTPPRGSPSSAPLPMPPPSFSPGQNFSMPAAG
ncbi:MAG: hypothetical protein JOY93_01240 [Acidobacteriales bacterium]|nr:hypothetical protein [Terriglobales bacterium]